MLDRSMTMKQSIAMLKDALVAEALERYHPTYKAAAALHCDYRIIIDHHPHQYIRTRDERRQAVNQ
jgi:hypothetical protein